VRVRCLPQKTCLSLRPLGKGLLNKQRRSFKPHGIQIPEARTIAER
jgi:hypothetical protein